ncbi:hypothetical protein R1flu_006441 [Riccia fluitans]|uniref:Uncharacterized protein n=1 Tax=Riccia fluitans TaxID=41844 RepID=A0ABD1YZ06_9MARC
MGSRHGCCILRYRHWLIEAWDRSVNSVESEHGCHWIGAWVPRIGVWCHKVKTRAPSGHCELGHDDIGSRHEWD